MLGTEGMIEVPIPFNARFEDADFLVYKGAEVSRFAATGANPYVAQADHFADAVRGGKPLAAGNDPVLSMRLIEACLDSARRRERVSLL
ncbi:hypothetical protein D3C85_1802000 [compost metagenome]